MLSVRITAAGAVFVCCLCLPTAPARACDDRYLNKCEKATAAAANAEETVAPAKRAKRVKLVATSRSRHTRFVRHRQAPRFAARLPRRVARNEDVDVAVPSNSPMARRFRGFIDPRPIAHNTFEALRRPRLMSLDFESAAILPVIDLAEAALPTPPLPADPASGHAVATTPKQDRLVVKPAALRMELASAESRPVALPPPPIQTAPVQVATTQPIVTEAPPVEPPKGKFSFHGLVLALCGALGAASALRFIVGA